jgi:hypothetical protein
MAMQMISVSSRAISAVGYNPASQQLCIRFHQGHAYTFCRVAQSIY